MITTFTLNVSIDRRYEVENARLGAVNRVKACSVTAGGKGLNVTRAIHVLGENVTASGIVGGDLGRFVMHALDAEGIRHDFTQVRGESRCCVNIYDMATGTQTEYLEPGQQVTPEEVMRFLEDFERLASASEAITMSGSLPRGFEKDTYARLIRRVRTRGRTKVFLDTSGVMLEMALPEKPYYIKPNEDELALLAGHAVEGMEGIVAAVRRLHAQGIPWVVASLGAQGAVLGCDEGVLLAVPPHVNTVNTVGCGDVMTGAFAVAAHRGYRSGEALKFAVAVSAASAMSPGTGELHMKDIEQVYPNVELTILA